MSRTQICQNVQTRNLFTCRYASMVMLGGCDQQAQYRIRGYDLIQSIVSSSSSGCDTTGGGGSTVTWAIDLESAGLKGIAPGLSLNFGCARGSVLIGPTAPERFLASTTLCVIPLPDHLHCGSQLFPVHSRLCLLSLLAISPLPQISALGLPSLLSSRPSIPAMAA